MLPSSLMCMPGALSADELVTPCVVGPSSKVAAGVPNWGIPWS